MIRTSKIEDAKARGNVLDMIPFEGFVHKHVFLTKAGDMGMMLRIRGRNWETMTQSEMDECVAQFDNSIRQFGHEFRMYQYLVRRDGTEVPAEELGAQALVASAVKERWNYVSGLQTCEAYLVILYTEYRVPITRLQKLRYHFWDRFSRKLTGRTIEERIYRMRQKLISAVNNVISALADVVPVEIIDDRQQFSYFVRMLNPGNVLAPHGKLKRSQHIDRLLAQSPIEVHSDHLRIGEQYVRVLSMVDMPAQVRDNMLRPLVESQGQFTAVTEFRRLPNSTVRRAIWTKRVALLAAKINIISVITRTLTNEQQVEEKNKATEDAMARLQQIESAIENDSAALGKFSLVVILHDQNQQRMELTLTSLYKALTDMAITMYPESLGLLRHFFATLPGNDRFNRRYRFLDNLSYSCAGTFLFLPQAGEHRNAHWNREYLIALETRHSTIAYLNLHYGDTPHVFICGQNGSGKSFLTNALVTHMQKYGRTITTIFDLGGSYRNIVNRLGGSYIELDLSRLAFQINPFCLTETRGNVHFISGFVRVLLEANEYRLTDKDATTLYERVEGMYRIPTLEHRTLSTLYTILPDHLRNHLARWVRKGNRDRKGEFAELFDNATDTFTLSDFQCFDFGEMEDIPEVGRPLMYYILHRKRTQMRDPELANTYKPFIMDEAWRLMMSGPGAEVTSEAMMHVFHQAKTGRKHEAAMILCTQAPEDMGDAARLMSEMGTYLFLSNPGLSETVYRDLFKLNDIELSVVRTLQRKRELMAKHPGQPGRILQFNATGWERDVFSSTPQKHALREVKSA